MPKIQEISKTIYGSSLLINTIVGAGIFALPYIALKSGIGVTIAYFFVLVSLAVLIHLFFSEVAMATPDFLRLPGYAKIYLGDWGKRVAVISTILGFYGATLAYLVLGGDFLKNLLSPIFGGGGTLYTFLYFLAGAILVYFGIKIITKVEFLGLILFFLILIAIFIKGIPFLRAENLFAGAGGIKDLFLPYGPIFFSLWGASIIPELEETLGRNKNLLKKIIILSVLISAIIYLLFIFLVLGISGINTSSDAISGLKNFLGEFAGIFFLFGIITTFTSFLSVGLTLKNTFLYDFKMTKNLSWFLALFLPFFLFLIGFKSFVTIIGVVGGVMLGIDGILILLMYKKIRPEKIFLVYPLALIFLGGIIYEIIYFIK